MAIKQDCRILLDNIQYKCDATGVKGLILAYSGSGSNSIHQDGAGYLVTVPGTGSQSGVLPAGLLLEDVVSQDETRFPLNRYKLETRVGGKVRLLKKGYVWTDKIKSGDTPSQGAAAYLAPNGEVTTTSATGVAQVGTFGGRKDSDGFALLNVDIN